MNSLQNNHKYPLDGELRKTVDEYIMNRVFAAVFKSVAIPTWRQIHNATYKKSKKYIFSL